MDETDRWWPADDELRRGGRYPMRAADVCYAALGPVVTHRLRSLLDSLPAEQVKDFGLGRLSSDLDRIDGREPTMLVLMATAMATVANEQWGRGADAGASQETSAADERFAALRAGWRRDDCFKFLGWQVVEQVQAFGLDEKAFLEYVASEYGHAFEGAWPPAGGAYTRRPPTPDGALASPPAEPAGAERSQADPLEHWAALDRHRGRPSLIGAHLVGLDDLHRYVDRLEEAVRYAAEDLEEAGPDAGFGPPEMRNELFLRAAVAKARRALALIDEAQHDIVQVFST